MSAPAAATGLQRTPLHPLHVARGARMAPFAGYDMPIQYPLGVLKEHLHTRAKAGLFDVSHMGQGWLHPGTEDPAAALESLVPGDLKALKPGQMRYTLLLNGQGGILDDLMVTRPLDRPQSLFLVVNAACKDADFGHLAERLQGRVRLERWEPRGLIALQGPAAAAVLARHAPAAGALKFMHAAPMELFGVPALVSRSGYTGEDGFEISIPADDALHVAERLLGAPEVEPIGLGARDSLRLEAGLCLYGHDIDETTTPVEASLTFALGKRRKEEANFPGAARNLAQLAEGPPRLRVGLAPEGRAPAREGAEVVDAEGRAIGRVTSGGFGPSADAPVAMGYVEARFASPGTELGLMVRGKRLPARVAPLPFVPHRYHRG